MSQALFWSGIIRLTFASSQIFSHRSPTRAASWCLPSSISFCGRCWSSPQPCSRVPPSATRSIRFGPASLSRYDEDIWKHTASSCLLSHTPVCLTHVCMCLSPEEDHAEHVFGCVDGWPSSSMPRLAPAHAPTRQCWKWWDGCVFTLYTNGKELWNLLSNIYFPLNSLHRQICKQILLNTDFWFIFCPNYYWSNDLQTSTHIKK